MVMIDPAGTPPYSEKDEAEEPKEPEVIPPKEEDNSDVPDEELTTEQVISKLFGKMDRLLVRLDDIPKEAERKTKALLEMFNDTRGLGIFAEDKQAEFFTRLHSLSEEAGHGYHTVLEVELARQRIAPMKPEEVYDMVGNVSRAVQPMQPATTPTIIQPSAPSLGVLSGYWYYKASKETAKVMAEMANRQQMQPKIGTSEKVTDILDFPRQLQPEFNKVQDFYHNTLHTLYFFHDEQTVIIHQLELQKHLNKLVHIIRTFCKTIAEYRKEAVLERQRMIAQSIVTLKMAESQALGGMRMSDMMRQIREAVGAAPIGDR